MHKNTVQFSEKNVTSEISLKERIKQSMQKCAKTVWFALVWCKIRHNTNFQLKKNLRSDNDQNMKRKNHDRSKFLERQAQASAQFKKQNISCGFFSRD